MDGDPGNDKAPTQSAPPDETQPSSPTGPPSAAIGTALNPAHLDAAAGSEATCRLHVRNEGSQPDTCRIEVLGQAASWASVEPATLSLAPGQDDAATIRFAPPEQSGPAPGQTPFQIRVTSSNDPSVSAARDSTLTVAQAPGGAQPAGAVATYGGRRPGGAGLGGFLRRHAAVLAAVAGVVVIAAASLLAWTLLTGGDGDVDVPELRGMTPAAAERVLTSEDLNVGEIMLETSDEPEGTVIGQQPAAGEPAASGTAVDITVAEPTPDAAVPDLVGQELADALQALADGGFAQGDVVEQESEEPAGTVIGQSPESGQEIEPGSDVSVTIAVPATTEDPLPDDEQCTDQIMSNERWVCLESASFDGDELVIEYEAEFAGSEPDRSDGFHLHLYGGDGVDPPAEIMGTHAPQPRGPWVIDDRPSPLTYPVGDGRDELLDRTAEQPKVCARIAQGEHELVPDNTGDGTFTTGNCVPIQRP